MIKFLLCFVEMMNYLLTGIRGCSRKKISLCNVFAALQDSRLRISSFMALKSGR